MFKLRIVSVDHYMANPVHGLDDEWSSFRESEIKRVPIIRVFGVTNTGTVFVMIIDLT